MTLLRPMPPEAFEAFRLASARGYADENVSSGRWPADGALERALDDFDRSLPLGLGTPDHHILQICAAPGPDPVGILWFAVIEKNGIRSAFVYDVEVEARHQRQGHARAAFALLEPLVRAMGLSSIGLHVFQLNVGAQALYKSLGYEIKSLNMLKQLSTP